MNSASKGNGNDEEMDRKPSSSGKVEQGGLSLPMKHGFAFAMEHLKPEELPGYVKQYFNALTFPEKLMLMLVHIEKMAAKEGRSGLNSPVAWTPDGSAFVIRNKDEIVKKWLPLFFSQAKYSSFTRKLYRWGFRKAMIFKKGDKGKTEVAFGNIYFRRDNHALMLSMKSITAAKLRRESTKEVERQDVGTSSAKSSPSRQSRAVLSQGNEGFSNLTSLSQSQQSQCDQRPADTPLSGIRQPHGDQLASSLASLSQLQQLQGGQSSSVLGSLLQFRQFQGGQGSADLAALAQLRQLQGGQQTVPDLGLLFQIAHLQGDQGAPMILSSLSQSQKSQENHMGSDATSLPCSSALNAPFQYNARPQQTDPSLNVNVQLQSTAINPNVLLALLLQSCSSQNPQVQQLLPTPNNTAGQLNLQGSIMQIQQGMNPSQLQGQAQGGQQQVQEQQATQQQVQPPNDDEAERLTQRNADTFRRYGGNPSPPPA